MQDSLNKIVSDYRAQVDGSVTALSGCSNATCSKNCLRKNSRLKLKVNLNTQNNNHCSAHIMVGLTLRGAE
jgi:hypothetical protein